jgi:diguanylate cyclase (GGDEF)-like protein
VLFNDRLEQGIVAARRSGQSLALMFIDLDRFKYINDSLGHQVGDMLLKEVAARMLNCIRKGHSSRLGGTSSWRLEGLQQAETAQATKIIGPWHGRSTSPATRSTPRAASASAFSRSTPKTTGR